MYLEPNMKQAVIRRTVRKFAEARLEPVTGEMEKTGEFPWEVFREMARLQYLGLEVPREYNGAGLEPVSSAIVIEEISRVSGAMGLCVSVHNSVSAYPVYTFGNEDQKERFLKPLASGERIGTFCLTEPNAGSDPSAMETSAFLDEDGYVLNGNKIFVTNGGVSGTNLVFARSPAEGRESRFSVFIVESEREGVVKGPPEELMGMRGNPVCPISFSDCRVPLENRLGEEGRGLHMALSVLNGGRIGIAAQALGIAQAALDASVKYAGERRQFGKSLSGFGAVQNMLADMETRNQAARMLTYRAADFRGRGIRHEREAAMAKLFAAEAAVEASRTAVQIHGGYGYSKAYPVERYYRDAKVCEIYEGTSEIQRIVIARGLMRP